MQKILTCDPRVLNLDCSRRANASARPRQDFPNVGIYDVKTQGLSGVAVEPFVNGSPASFIYLFKFDSSKNYATQIRYVFSSEILKRI